MADTKVYLSGERIQGASTDTSGEPDTLGTSANGTLIGDPTGGDTSPTPPTGLGTSSFVFDGNDGITIDGAEPFSTTVGSISLWFYNDGTSNDKGVLFFGDTDASSYLGIETKTDGIWAKFRQASGTTSQWEWRSSNNSVTLTDAWHHLVISQDGTAVKIYVDAVELTTFDASTDKSKWMESNLDNGRIGCNSISGNGNANFLTGNLMEIGLWNVALTSAQVTSLYGNGGSTAKTADTIPTGLKAYYPLSGSVVTNAAVVVDKSKDSITNVPVGTRYEETDTKKIYRFRDEGFSANSVGIYGDLISNDSGTLTNPTSAPTGLASAGNTKCFDSSGMQIKGRTGIGGLSARNWFPSGSDWTISFWYKSDNWNVGGSNSPAPFNIKNSSGTARGWIEFSSGPNAPSGDEPNFNVSLYQNGGGGNGKVTIANSTGTLTTGVWHWIVIDWDDSAGTLTWSVDTDTSGVGYGTVTNAAITSLDISTIDYWIIGADAERFDGQITDICFWNTLLTSQQKTNLWASGAGALATTESKSNIIMYHDCQSITFPITNKATSPGWVEKGVA